MMNNCRSRTSAHLYPCLAAKRITSYSLVHLVKLAKVSNFEKEYILCCEDGAGSGPGAPCPLLGEQDQIEMYTDICFR